MTRHGESQWRRRARVLLGVLVLGLALFGPSSSRAAPPASALEVRFLGNEGFLIESGGKKVLVDALVSATAKSYVVQPPELRHRLERAQPPFDDVDLILATHHHADHFDPQAVCRHLKNNTRAVFVSTRQAVADLEKACDGLGRVRDRVRAVSPVEGKRVRLPALGLEVLNLHHGRDRNPPVQNHGFLIRVGGWKLLHVGDTEITAEEIRPNGLHKDDVDIAMVPSWLLTYDRWKGVVEAIAPEEIVVMHLPPNWGFEEKRRVRQILGNFPAALTFREVGQRHTFRAP